MTTGGPLSARERVRKQLTTEIKEAARRQIADVGSGALSLRAVAREVGMVSSALYRYFPSRDDLLTALIIDAYVAVGDAAVRAEAVPQRRNVKARWLALMHGVRGWAVERPQEYALIFGTPVPGYRAPRDTIDPAARIPLLLLQILADAGAAGRLAVPVESPIPAAVRADLNGLRRDLGTALSEPQLARATMAWTQLIGTISFELFGHLNNVIHDYDAYFDYQMRRVADHVGLL